VTWPRRSLRNHVGITTIALEVLVEGDPSARISSKVLEVVHSV
jgi:hypothetical protein